MTILDDDRELAAAAYTELRVRLTSLLRWWGAADPEMLADLAFDRAARKLQEGAAVERDNFSAYLRGVARMVFYEAARQPQPLPLDRDPMAESHRADDAPLDCLDRCLGILPPEDRRLVLRYYEGANQIAARQQLAREMGISQTALRIRTHRLRARLEDCVTTCLNPS